MYGRVCKRLADVVVATALLVLLSPLIVVVAALVLIMHGSPILYHDERAGLNGRPISITKFRSMRNHTSGNLGSLSDAERLTRFGRFLRQTSLDELPQLVSVVKGDMSLVGPRPLPLRYVSRYDERQATRLLVRPGLTGWAQVHGRNAVDWPKRLEYDAEYVEMLDRWWAPFADGWIVLLTAVQLIWQGATGRGISAPGAATMREFEP